MASYGNYTNNNMGNLRFTPTVTGYEFYNSESVVDKTMLSCSMWKSTIKIAIYPIIETGNENEKRVDRTNGAPIYLTAMKTMMLCDLLKNFLRDPKRYSNHSIVSRNNLITIVRGEDIREDAGPCLFIRQIETDGKTSRIKTSYPYEFKHNFYHEITGYDEKSGKFSLDFDSHQYDELKAFIVQLEEYYKAMTNAQAFAVYNTMFDSIDKIAAKLGVDLNSNYNGQRYNSGYNNTQYNQSNFGGQQQDQSQNNYSGGNGLIGLMG